MEPSFIKVFPGSLAVHQSQQEEDIPPGMWLELSTGNGLGVCVCVCVCVCVWKSIILLIIISRFNQAPQEKFGAPFSIGT